MKTYFRNSMNQERLNHVAVLHVHQARRVPIPMRDGVTRFLLAHSETIASPKHRGWEQQPWASGGSKGDRSPTKFEIPQKSPTIFAMVTHRHPHPNLC